MEPDLHPEEKTPGKFENLHKVTPFSTYLAMALFIALPFIGGYVGYHFALETNIEVPVVVEIEDKPTKQIELVQKNSDLLALIRFETKMQQIDQNTETVRAAWRNSQRISKCVPRLVLLSDDTVITLDSTSFVKSETEQPDGPQDMYSGEVVVPLQEIKNLSSVTPAIEYECADIIYRDTWSKEIPVRLQNLDVADEIDKAFESILEGNGLTVIIKENTKGAGSRFEVQEIGFITPAITLFDNYELDPGNYTVTVSILGPDYRGWAAALVDTNVGTVLVNESVEYDGVSESMSLLLPTIGLIPDDFTQRDCVENNKIKELYSTIINYEPLPLDDICSEIVSGARLNPIPGDYMMITHLLDSVGNIVKSDFASIDISD